MMRFLKDSLDPHPSESGASAARLNAVIARGRVEIDLYPRVKDLPELQRAQRCIWTPEDGPPEDHLKEEPRK